MTLALSFYLKGGIILGHGTCDRSMMLAAAITMERLILGPDWRIFPSDAALHVVHFKSQSLFMV